MDRAYVSGLEKGERNRTIVTLWHTAKALGVKVRSLFDEPTLGRKRIESRSPRLDKIAATES